MGKVEELTEKLEKETKELHIFLDNVPLGLDYPEYLAVITPEYNKVEAISRELRLIKPYELSDLSTYGDLMTLDEFKDYCWDAYFIDSDGSGNYANENEESDISIHPSDVINNMVRKDFTHVIWFNK